MVRCAALMSLMKALRQTIRRCHNSRYLSERRYKWPFAMKETVTLRLLKILERSLKHRVIAYSKRSQNSLSMRVIDLIKSSRLIRVGTHPRFKIL